MWQDGLAAGEEAGEGEGLGAALILSGSTPTYKNLQRGTNRNQDTKKISTLHHESFPVS